MRVFSSSSFCVIGWYLICLPELVIGNKGTKNENELEGNQVYLQDDHSVTLKNMEINSLTKKNTSLLSPYSFGKQTRRKTRRRNKNRKVRITAQRSLLKSAVDVNGTALPKTKTRKRKQRRRKLRKNRRKQKQIGIMANLVESTTNRTHRDSNVTSKTYLKRRPQVNRCSKNKGGCSQICKPNGKERCACLEGFFLDDDGLTCIDINECRINNGNCEALCVNMLGSYECRCPEGLRLADDRSSCEDINECLLRNGHGLCQDTCHNTYGSYKCSCDGLNGTILASDNHTCEDIDECAFENGGCSHQCINTLRTTFCSCPEGMELSSDWRTCQDINECEEENVKKTCITCINTEGSYRCEVLGMQNDDLSHKVACEPLFPPAHGFVSCSREGAYHIYTPKGRKRIINSPGTSCKLVCPVGYKLVGEFLLMCGLHGQWKGTRSGKCIRAPGPIISCPPTQYISLKNDSEKVLVKIPSPMTNINWKHVRSNPRWAKDLVASLAKGQYDIDFTVKDPTTKLYATCAFRILVGE